MTGDEGRQITNSRCSGLGGGTSFSPGCPGPFRLGDARPELRDLLPPSEDLVVVPDGPVDCQDNQGVI
jgi:hypothetical protein